MSNNEPCVHSEDLRDYAFDELPGGHRETIEQHLTTCGNCALELDRLRMTTAALRTLPDREIPQRIAFVSDRVFAASPASRLFGAWFLRANFGGFWNSAARLGFASACVLAVALVISAYHRPGVGAGEVRTIVQTASAPADLSNQVNQAVAKAVAQIREDDARVIQAALAVSDKKHEDERRELMVAWADSLTVLQKRLNTWTIASNATENLGAGQ
jgi:anti-sigma factor RsiW